MSDLKEYKCPACGGALEFDSKTQKMKCPYCDTEIDMEALRSYDEDMKEPASDDMKWDEMAGGQWEKGETDQMRVYVCNSCGGEIVADENTGASSCPYCGNPVVMKEQFSGSLRPDYVIPFKLDKKAAKNAYLKHIQGKPLLPKIFKDQNHIDEIKGVYVPFWLFDAEADAGISYKATKQRVWSDSNYNYTETSYYSVRREGKIGFQRVPVDGSTRMDDDLMESIEPFDFKDAVDFQTAYLAGYIADKYDVTAQESIDRANERIKKSVEEEFRETVRGYATVVPERTNVRLSNGVARYALYPVWILNTTWNGQKFTFAMNGQTGRLVGDLPVDKGAYWKWFGIVTAVSSVAAYGIAWLIHLL